MSIRTKILIYFSVITIFLIGAVFLFVFTLFSSFRQSQFREEQAIKIKTTLKILTVRKQIDKTMIESIDTITIKDLYNEKLLIFDQNKSPIYSSIDDTKIPYYKSMLSNLNTQSQRIELKDSLFDVVGIYLEQDGKGYYGICKAYDVSGYRVMNYLKKVLIFSFIGISLVLFIALYYFSGQITQSILHVTRQIKNYDFEHNVSPIICKNNNDEIALLVKRFNQLMTRMNKAYLFQKHAVHHISHELKTPISVLVSNFEKMERENDINKLKELIVIQKEDTKSLSDIINSLLEIAKVESGKGFEQSNIRIDELLFDIAEELQILYPGFQFLIEFNQEVEDEQMLSVSGNLRLLKAAFTNLMVNSTHFTNDNTSRIYVSVDSRNLVINFTNRGNTINEDEQQFLFQHFFRGQNSKGTRGFGLGLVLVNKILTLHGGTIRYSVKENDCNIFTVILPREQLS
jgi:signal transduction histidine kinase